MKKVAPYIRCVIFLGVLLGMFSVFDYVFSPYGYVRYILHQATETEQKYDTLILGASHGRSAIDPSYIDQALNCNSLNLSIPGETVEDSYYLLKETCSSNDIKTLILDVDYQYWFQDQPTTHFTKPFIYQQMKWSKVKLEYLVDNMSTIDIRNVVSKRLSYDVSLDAAKKNIEVKGSAAYKDYALEVAQITGADGPYKGKGFFMRKTSGLLPGGQGYVDSWVARQNADVDQYVLNYFSQIKNYCDAHNIKLVCVTSPITPTSMKKLGMGVVNKKMRSQVFDAMGVEYYDFNKALFDVIPRDDIAYGDREGHMGGELAEDYSKVLSQVLKESKDGNLNESKYFYDSFKQMYDSKEYQQVMEAGKEKK